jgi:hypothetical protein
MAKRHFLSDRSDERVIEMVAEIEVDPGFVGIVVRNGSLGLHFLGSGGKFFVKIFREIKLDLVVIGGFGASGFGRIELRVLAATVVGFFRLELSHQFFFEINAEIVVAGSIVGGICLFNRLARVETHDPRQFSERIFIRNGSLVGDFQMVSVYHYLFRTRTQSDAMDVA